MMARYIDVEELKQERDMAIKVYENANILNAKAVRQYLKPLLDKIVDMPTVDVAEVKHGYNKTSMHPVDEFWCSECGFCCADYTETKYDEDGDYTYSCECEFDYCPRCGAKMDSQ